MKFGHSSAAASAAMLFALSFGSLLIGGGQAPGRETPVWTIRMDLQVVAIPPARALELVPRLQDGDRFDAAFDELQQMIAADQVDLIDWPVIVTDAGSRAIDPPHSEAYFEVRYPVEFTPPKVPQIFRSTQPEPIPPTGEVIPVPLWGAMEPTAFEARNSGLTFTGEGKVSVAGDRIALNVKASRCEFLSFHVARGVKSSLGIDGLAEVPDFLVNKATSHVALPNGKRTLLGTFVEAKPNPRVVVFLLKAVATPSGTKSESP